MLLKPGYIKRPVINTPLPTLDIDFTRGAPWDDRLTFTRASTGTWKDSAGNIQTAGANAPRYAYDGSGNCLGLIMEEARTNVLYNSAAPATQTRSLTSGKYVLWMEGSGSVTLSGGPTGSATAGNPVRFELASTTSVTFTVSGTVSRFQCSASTASDSVVDFIFPTSFIPTPVGSSATRAKDILSFASTGWFNNTEGTMIIEHILPHQFKQTMRLWTMTPDYSGTVIEMLYQTEPNQRAIIRNAWNSECDFLVPTPALLTPVNIIQKFAFGYKANNCAFASNGTLRGADVTATIPVTPNGYIGGDHNAANPFSGIIRRIIFWDKKLDNGELVKRTT